MSRVNAGMNAIYNGGLQSGYMQSGNGRILDFLKKGHKWTKDNKIISKIGDVVNAVGGTDYINKKTGGKFGQAIDYGSKKGYGKKRGPGRPRKVGRPRKSSGSKKASGSKKTSKKRR